MMKCVDSVRPDTELLISELLRFAPESVGPSGMKSFTVVEPGTGSARRIRTLAVVSVGV